MMTSLFFRICAASVFLSGCFYDTSGEPADIADTASEVDSDTSPDGGDPSGLGVPCTQESDCAEFEANACTYSEMTGSGYCTFADCVAGECPTPYLCCQCAGVTGIDAVFCAGPGDVATIASMSLCPCE